MCVLLYLAGLVILAKHPLNNPLAHLLAHLGEVLTHLIWSVYFVTREVEGEREGERQKHSYTILLKNAHRKKICNQAKSETT